MGHNIDNADDDEYMAVTEAMGLIGQAQEDKGTGSLLAINIGLDGSHSGVMGGTLDTQTIERFEEIIEQLKQAAAEDQEEGAKVLHVWSV